MTALVRLSNNNSLQGQFSWEQTHSLQREVTVVNECGTLPNPILQADFVQQWALKASISSKLAFRFFSWTSSASVRAHANLAGNSHCKWQALTGWVLCQKLVRSQNKHCNQQVLTAWVPLRKVVQLKHLPGRSCHLLKSKAPCIKTASDRLAWRQSIASVRTQQLIYRACLWAFSVDKKIGQ